MVISFYLCDHRGLEGEAVQSELPVVAIQKQLSIVFGKRNRPKQGVEGMSLRETRNDYATMAGDRGRPSAQFARESHTAAGGIWRNAEQKVFLKLRRNGITEHTPRSHDLDLPRRGNVYKE